MKDIIKIPVIGSGVPGYQDRWNTGGVIKGEAGNGMYGKGCSEYKKKVSPGPVVIYLHETISQEFSKEYYIRFDHPAADGTVGDFSP